MSGKTRITIEMGILAIAASAVLFLSYLEIIPFIPLSVAFFIGMAVYMVYAENWNPASRIVNAAIIGLLSVGILGGANIGGYMLRLAASLFEQISL